MAGWREKETSGLNMQQNSLWLLQSICFKFKDMGHEVYSGSFLTFHGLLCVYCFVERLSGSINVIATKPQTSILDGDYGCDVLYVLMMGSWLECHYLGAV